MPTKQASRPKPEGNPRPETTAEDLVQNQEIRKTQLQLDAEHEAMQTVEQKLDKLVAAYEHGVKHQAPHTHTFLEELKALREEIFGEDDKSSDRR